MGAPYFFTEEELIGPGLPLKIEKARQMDCVPFHGHDFIEIAFVADGSALHRHTGADGHTRLGGLIQGDLFSVLPGERHGYEECGSMVLYNIFLKPEWIETYRHLENLPGWRRLLGRRSTVPEGCLHLSAAARSRATQCLDRAVYECRFAPPGCETLMTALFLEFLITAIRPGEAGRNELGENSFGILESISLMEGTPERRFSLRQLAAVSNMSVPSYTKKFRQATGVSPMEYLFKVRLVQVRHFLAETDLTIGEIATRCGFCTPNYLIKLFRRELGITPVQYRREQFEKNGK